MPSALRIRKEILKALDESIIPALWKQQVALGYVAPPLQFPANIEKYVLSDKLPRRNTESSSFPIQAIWTSAKLHSTTHPYLSFIYEGAAQERTLITASQASQNNIKKGVYAIHWQAPGALYFPTGAPRNTGAYKFFHQHSNTYFSSLKILQLALRDKILIHTRIETVSKEETSHSLQIKDASLLALARIFQDELEHALAAQQETAQAALLVFMLRLRNQLSSQTPYVANTSYPQIVASELPNKHTQTICQTTIHYIQTHLNEPLSLPVIARKIGLSPTHLNRLFRQANGVSIMRYVKLQRIAAAKKILELHTENVSEIATLVGFGSSTVFCRAFLRETGLTPNQYRRQMRQDKSTF